MCKNIDIPYIYIYPDKYTYPNKYYRKKRRKRTIIKNNKTSLFAHYINLIL